MTDLDPEKPQDSRKINESIEKSTEKLEQEETTESEPVAPFPSTPLKDVTRWKNITFESPSKIFKLIVSSKK